jgi:OmpA-OmpF porin, OOP family
MNSNRTQLSRAAALAVLLAAASPAAMAQFYIGGAFGAARVQNNDAADRQLLLSSGFTSATVTSDTTRSGWKFYAGYDINSWFSLEGGYMSAGKFRQTINTTGPAVSASGDARATAFMFDGVARFPVTDTVRVLGRLGVHRSKVDGQARATGPGGTVVVGGDDNATDWRWGFGAEYMLNKSVGVRAEFEQFRGFADQGKLDLWSVGLSMRF